MPREIRIAAIAVLFGSAFALWAAPVPKDAAKPKATDQEEAVAVEGDADAMWRNERASINNLEQILKAVHNFAGANNDALPYNVPDGDGEYRLSWRVLLLPYVEEVALYKQFKLDEPWDSANNIKLLEKMPKVFDSPRVKVKKGYTVYQGFTGNGAIIGSQFLIGTIPDGTSNTIWCVEATTAVPWTKPVDMPFDPEKDLPKFGKAFGEKPLAALCDGSVRTLDLKKISAKTLKNAIDGRDGNPLGDDW